MKTHYEILGIDPKATAQDIKKAYHKRALEIHPDKNPNDPSAEEKFKELQTIYAILSHPLTRFDYDKTLPKNIIHKSNPPTYNTNNFRKTDHTFTTNHTDININKLNEAIEDSLNFELFNAFALKKALKFIRQGANPNVQSKTGNSLLHELMQEFQIAYRKASNGVFSTVPYFNVIIDIASGCNINIDPNSVWGNKKEIIIRYAFNLMMKIINYYHFNLNLQKKDGTTALDMLLELVHHLQSKERNHLFLELAMELVRMGANPNLTYNQHRSLLNCMISHNENGDYDRMIKELIEKHHANTNHQLTPLQCIIDGDWSFNIAKVMDFYLAKHAVNPNSQGKKGNTLLHFFLKEYQKAAEAKQYARMAQIKDAIHDLIHKYGANIHTKNNQQKSFVTCLLEQKAISPILSIIIDRINPGLKDSTGNSPLHLLVKEFVALVKKSADSELPLQLIFELATKYGFDINIKNANDENLLQVLRDEIHMCCDFFYNLLAEQKILKAAIRLAGLLVKLGVEDKSFYLPYLLKCEKERIPENEKLSCSAYLQLILFLANERENKKSGSIFKVFPVNVNLMILSYLDYQWMGKTQAQAISLANEIFTNTAIIRQSLGFPGGFNVYQLEDKSQQNNNYKFLFYKSAKTLATDFDLLKKALIVNDQNERNLAGKKPKKGLSKAAKTKLKAFRKQYAIFCWEQHASLFSSSEEKQKLYAKIKNTDLFNPIVRKIGKSLSKVN